MSANSACPKCKHVTDERTQKITLCNACDGFWHIACANISAKFFETVKKLNIYLWFCDKCIGEIILAERVMDFGILRVQILLQNFLRLLRNWTVTSGSVIIA